MRERRKVLIVVRTYPTPATKMRDHPGEWIVVGLFYPPKVVPPVAVQPALL